MRTFLRCVFALGFIGVGYFFGATGLLVPESLRAQVVGGPTDETKEKITDAYSGLNGAMEALLQDQLYKPATNGLNTFAITAGGVDALRDLEEGRGVDPETFAGLYADQAIDQVKDQLDRDDQGRITYKGRVVRMYPISRLKKFFEARKEYSGDAPAP